MQAKLFEETFIKALGTIRSLLPASCFSTSEVMQNPFTDSPKAAEETIISCCVLDTSLYALVVEL